MVEDTSDAPPAVDRLARWPSLAERDAGVLPEPELYEGVPAHLEHYLRGWVSRVVIKQDSLIQRVLTRLRVSWNTVSQMGPYEVLMKLIAGDTGFIEGPQGLDQLSVVNAIIALHPTWQEVEQLEAAKQLGAYVSSEAWSHQLHTWFVQLDELEGLLRDSGSAWRVERDWHGLFRRVDPTATEAWRHAWKTAEASGHIKPAQHLAEAWRTIYGQQPDPGAGYAEAVKAVEAAALPVVFPDQKATIHQVRNQLKAAGKNGKRDQWRFSLVEANSVEPGRGSIEPAASMLDRLLRGQTDRHASADHNRPVTQAEAETAVHLAVPLVQWFVSGAIGPRT